MAEPLSELEIVDVPEAERFEARLDGEVLGFAEYRLQGDSRIVFTHTEVGPEHHGVGSALARGALDQVRAAGERKVVPRCPFIRGWIERHPDYADLVAEDR